MTINSEIKIILNNFGIPVDDGLSHLVSIYFGLKPSYTPIAIVEKINRTGIISNTESQTGLQWNVPLFDEQVTGFEWVTKEYLQLFKDKNKDRAGGAKESISRMKKFFANNPAIRKDDVIEATKMYLKQVGNPNYIITSHYFIYKGVGADKTQTLLHWVEKYLESKQDSLEDRTTHNTMMKG